MQILKNFLNCKGAMLLAFLILNSSLLTLSAQNRAIDSIRRVLKTSKDDTNKVRTLNALSDKLESTGNYDSSLAYGEDSRKLAEKLNYKKGIADAFINIGIIYFDKDNYSEAMDYYTKAMAIYEETGDKFGISITYGNMGNIYYEQGNYPKSIEYDLKSLAMDEQLNNKFNIAHSLSNIGIIYYDEGNYPKALEYSLKAYQIDKELGNKNGMSTDLDDIAIVYERQGNYSKALEYEFNALPMAKEVKDKSTIESILSNIGTDYFAMNDYIRAAEYFFKSADIGHEIGDNYGLSTNFENIGNNYAKEKNYEMAKVFIDSSLDVAIKIGAKERIKSGYKSLAGLDSANGDYKKSLEDYKNYIIYRDSLVNEKNIRDQMNAEFTQQQASEKAEQDKKDALAEAERRKQGVITWSVLSGLLLTLVFAGLIFQSLRTTRKQKDIIEIKNRDILDSISYAKRLQDAILPPISLIQQYLPEAFVLYKPKDIVAGDFYWIARSPLPMGEGQGEVTLIAAADCTGHGVPGALVSVVCSNALNRTVKEFKITEPGRILDKVRELVLETFEKSESNVQDGMDISLCAISPLSAGEGPGVRLSWSGAYNSLWYIMDGKMTEIPADKQPIGKTDNPKPFTTYTITIPQVSLNPSEGGTKEQTEIPLSGGVRGAGTTLYLFTDGFADQFGGPKGKKFKYKQLQQLIMDNAQLTMEEQKKLLEQTFEKWKGDLEQVDDVLVIGIRIGYENYVKTRETLSPQGERTEWGRTS